MIRKASNPAELAEFVHLLTTHQSMIRGYIRTLIPNASDAPDILQNTNIVLWEKREAFQAGSNFKAWAFAIARFRAMNHRKKQLRKKELVLDESIIELLEQCAPQDESWMVEQQQLALEQCLGGLKSKDRELIHHRYAAHTRLADYAQIIGSTPASLRVKLNRLRDVLRHCLAQKLEGDLS